MSKSQQLLLRLPDDLATRLAQLVAPRQRNRFMLDLLRRELDRDSAELAQAAMLLNQIEANSPLIVAENTEWINATLVDDEDAGFDPNVFERQFNEAQANRKLEKVA